MWRADDQQQRPVALLKHDGNVLDAQWSSRGDFIITTSLDGTVRIWDRKGNYLVRLSEGNTHWWRARFSRDDRYVVTASAGGIEVWELPRLTSGFAELVRCKEYKLDGNHLVPVSPPAGCT